jgi:hypothetical protein
LPQQTTAPAPCLVHRTSVLQVSQLYLLPSVLAILVQSSYLESLSDTPLFLQGHRLSAAVKLTLPGAGHDELRAALGASVSLAHLISH